MGRIKCGGGDGGEPARSPPGWKSYASRVDRALAWPHDPRTCRWREGRMLTPARPGLSSSDDPSRSERLRSYARPIGLNSSTPSDCRRPTAPNARSIGRTSEIYQFCPCPGGMSKRTDRRFPCCRKSIAFRICGDHRIGGRSRRGQSVCQDDIAHPLVSIAPKRAGMIVLCRIQVKS